MEEIVKDFSGGDICGDYYSIHIIGTETYAIFEMRNHK